MANSLHDIPGEHVACVPFREHAAATATERQHAWVAPFKCKVTACDVIFDANITGADTNYTDVGTSFNGGSDIINEDSFQSGTDAVAGSPHPFTGAHAANNLPVTLDAGDVIQVDWTKTGNGLKIPTGLLVIKYQGA